MAVEEKRGLDWLWSKHQYRLTRRLAQDVVEVLHSGFVETRNGKADVEFVVKLPG